MALRGCPKKGETGSPNEFAKGVLHWIPIVQVIDWDLGRFLDRVFGGGRGEGSKHSARVTVYTSSASSHEGSFGTLPDPSLLFGSHLGRWQGFANADELRPKSLCVPIKTLICLPIGSFRQATSQLAVFVRGKPSVGEVVGSWPGGFRIWLNGYHAADWLLEDDELLWWLSWQRGQGCTRRRVSREKSRFGHSLEQARRRCHSNSDPGPGLAQADAPVLAFAIQTYPDMQRYGSHVEVKRDTFFSFS